MLFALPGHKSVASRASDDSLKSAISSVLSSPQHVAKSKPQTPNTENDVLQKSTEDSPKKVQSPLNPPSPQKSPPKPNIVRTRRNQNVIIEDELSSIEPVPSPPIKTEPLKPGKLAPLGSALRYNKVAPQIPGTPKRYMTAPSGSRKILPAPSLATARNTSPTPRKNKVGPCDDSEIPPENLVTCDVVVHREKTPSVSSTREIGLYNTAYEHDDELDNVFENTTCVKNKITIYKESNV